MPSVHSDGWPWGRLNSLSLRRLSSLWISYGITRNSEVNVSSLASTIWYIVYRRGNTLLLLSCEKWELHWHCCDLKGNAKVSWLCCGDTAVICREMSRWICFAVVTLLWFAGKCHGEFALLWWHCCDLKWKCQGMLRLLWTEGKCQG